MMYKVMKRQEGAFMVLMAIMIVVLLGFAALAIDVGRMLVLRAEMQNAVDAAAVAAAKELDGQSNARDRAIANARNALEHNSHFARVKELLGEVTLPSGEGGAFTFFCIIGSEPDLDPDNKDVDLTKFCSSTTPYASTGVDSEKLEALNDEEAHYVRVNLSPDVVDVDNFSISMIFLPVLNLFGADQFLTEIALSANALAGRNHFACNFPPLMMCDPFEEGGEIFREEMAGAEGSQIILKKQGPGSPWKSGNFGLLQLKGANNKETTRQLADERLVGCMPALVDTNPGEKTPLRSGINTRFGVYDKADDWYPDLGSVFGVKGEYVEFPPDPNVVSFDDDVDGSGISARDTDFNSTRIGNGQWDCKGYWEVAKGRDPGLRPLTCKEAVLNTMTREEMYKHELSTPGLAREDEHPVDPNRLVRRHIYIAVLSCESLGINGNEKDVSIAYPDGFAHIFLTEPVKTPSGSDTEFIGEYLGWGTEDDGFLHVDIQLYE